MDKNTDDALPRTRRGLRDLRLRNRLVLLVLLPLIAGVALGTARIVTENDAITAEGNLAGQVQVAITFSKLVHSVQDERDLIAKYLADGQRPEDKAPLAAAENSTDALIRQVVQAQQQYAGSIGALSPSAQSLVLQAQARLSDLGVLRASVTVLGDSRPVFQAYTTVINTLMNFSDQLATGTADHVASSLVNTLSLVETAGEQTSQERGYLVSILGGGTLSRAQQEALIEAQATYSSALSTFVAQAAPQNAALFQATVGGSSTGTVDGVVQQVIDAALDGRPVNSVNIDPIAAYNAATAKLTQIRAVEAQIGTQALNRVAYLQSTARTQLYLNAGIVMLTLLLAFGATVLIARTIVEPLKVLRSSAYEIATVNLPAVIRRLRDASDVDVESATRIEPIAVRSRDEIGEVARAFDEVHDAAVRLATEQALLRGNVNAMFKNLSRRSQSLVERQLLLIDNLENSEKDPGQLAQLFKLDHLATRMRRNNENLLVLAGEETARRWTEAVQLVDVARAAAAEVEQYERIMFGEIPRTRIVGKAAPDVAHLVAELLENATTYSSPQTKVWVAARGADDGGVILHIEDVGIGMTAADLQKTNERLSRPPLVDVGVSRQMGLFVVGRLAARYGIRVTLSESPAGGVTASIHLPVTLIDLGAMAGRRPGESGTQPRITVPGLTREGFTGGGLLASGEGSGEGRSTFPRRRVAEPPAMPSADGGADPRRPREQPAVNGSGRPVGNPVLPGPTGAPLFPGPARSAEDPDAEPGEQTWFAPKREQEETDGKLPVRRPQERHDGRAQIPPPRPAAANERQAARPADAAPPDTNERLPIFEAVESEWFRRRGTTPPHSGWSPRSVQPWDTTRAVNASAQAQGAAQPAPLGAAGTQSTNTARLEPVPAGRTQTATEAPAEPTQWSSPGDEAWKAAAALAQPVRDGVTATGLPRRVPKANLVPGKAGGDGAGKAAPPPGLSMTAEAVRKRLSTFRRNSQQLAGETEQS